MSKKRFFAVLFAAIFTSASAWLAYRLSSGSSIDVGTDSGLLVFTMSGTIAGWVFVFLPLTSQLLSATPGEWDSETRLKDAILTRERSGVAAVLFGSFVAVGGVAVMLWRASSVNPNETGAWLNALTLLGPVIMIQALAFYFLRLHSKAGVDLRHYHNELTNLESKRLALQELTEAAAANPLTEETAKLRELVVTDLLKTERNRVLEKGQTAISSDGAKAEADRLDTILGMVLKHLKKD